MEPSPADLEGLIRALVEREVAFLIVGGAAAVLHGAPTTTLDLDIVPEQSEPNLDRLLIQIKGTTGRARDRIVVPILLALLRERERTP